MFSPYSSFFNSGLLASPGSRHHRRTSLPESTTYTSSSHKTTSYYYVSLQRRGQSEHRSFLSLDLAESRLSERHGPLSNPTGTSSWLIPPVPALPPLVISPLRSHFSRSSLTLTAPKPTMLPDPPPPPYSQHRKAPRLPELPVLPALQFPPTYTKMRPLPSPPSPLSSSPSPSPFKSVDTPFSPTTEDDIGLSPILPRCSVLTKPRHLRSKKPKNLGIITNPDRLSKSSFSTVSTRVRRRNRWDALDTLEGRRKQPAALVPPVPQKRNLNMADVFVKPTTFATHPKPLPNRVVPNFMNMYDDSDPEPESGFDSSSVSDFDSDDHPKSTHPNTNPALPNPLLEPEDIVLPAAPVRPRCRPPSSVLDALSYLDVDGEEEEAVVLEATRCPAPSSPPPPVLTPIPPTQPLNKGISRLKGPVERHVPPKPLGPTIGRNLTSAKEKDRTKSKSKSKHHHQPSSSKRPKPSASTSARSNHNHYKSFIELDMDEQDPPAGAPQTSSSSAAAVGVIVEDPEAEVELFEWRGRMGRGLAEGGAPSLSRPTTRTRRR